jgi:hypothetical protein
LKPQMIKQTLNTTSPDMILKEDVQVTGDHSLIDNSHETIELPTTQIQSDWEYCFKQKESKSAKFWLNVHLPHQKSIYGEVEVYREGDDFRIKVSHPEVFAIASYDKFV